MGLLFWWRHLQWLGGRAAVQMLPYACLPPTLLPVRGCRGDGIIRVLDYMRPGVVLPPQTKTPGVCSLLVSFHISLFCFFVTFVFFVCEGCHEVTLRLCLNVKREIKFKHS